MEQVMRALRADQEEERGVACVGTNSAWMRRHLSDSIYLWACGEKADDKDDDPKLSDRLIGWLILFGFAYTMLIFLARAAPTSDTGSSDDDSGNSSYLLPSVTGAMYLLVAATSHDLRAGFSLLVDGSCAGHRSFGCGLLIVYGIMITAATTVLVKTSDDSASVLLNAVTVLFVADLDEKALHFLMSVPQKWRLFWALHSLGISFTLAVVAIVYIGDSSKLLGGNNGVLQTWPNWFIWMVNPVGATVSSVLLSSTLQAVCDFCSEACEGVDEPTFGLTVKRVIVQIFEIMKIAKERFRGQPFFYVTRGMWLAQVVPNFFYTQGNDGFPLAFVFAEPNAPTPTSEEEFSLEITDNKLFLLLLNGVLAVGLVLKALALFLPNHQCATSIPELQYSSEGNECRQGRGSWAGSRVSSLLVGWGVGYWVTSFLSVLVCAWHGSGCGWYSAPIVVTILGYALVPCVISGGVFMVADTNVLGTRFGGLVKPAVDILRNRDRVEFWVMATVHRDFVVVWLGYCNYLRLQLQHLL